MTNERQRCGECNNAYADVSQSGRYYCSTCYLETFSPKHKKAKEDKKVSSQPILGLHGEILC